MIVKADELNSLEFARTVYLVRSRRSNLLLRNDCQPHRLYNDFISRSTMIQQIEAYCNFFQVICELPAKHTQTLDVVLLREKMIELGVLLLPFYRLLLRQTG